MIITNLDVIIYVFMVLDNTKCEKPKWSGIYAAPL